MISWQMSIPFRDRLNQRGFYAGIETYINGPGRTGFTENNSRVLDRSMMTHSVFTATSAKASYYRVAVDAEYTTGTGWQAGAEQTRVCRRCHHARLGGHYRLRACHKYNLNFQRW